MQINKQREHDIYIMKVIKRVHPTTIELKHINTCRMCLKVFFLSDIVNADRNTKKSLYFYEQSHNSTLVWQNIPLPPKRS